LETSASLGRPIDNGLVVIVGSLLFTAAQAIVGLIFLPIITTAWIAVGVARLRGQTRCG
jgi:hypothetical protein